MSATRGRVRVGQIAYGIFATLVILAATYVAAGVMLADILPLSWHGYRVIDGDVTDLRYRDPSPVIVGLRAKGTARRDATGFVVRTEGRATR